MKKISRKTRIVFLLNLLIIITAVVWFRSSLSRMTPVSYGLEDWLSQNAVYRDNGLFVNDELRDSAKEQIFLWGPYGTLKKGSYTALIRYTAEYDQQCLATAAGGKGPAQLYDSSEGILSRNLHELVYRFEVLDDVTDFQIVFTYNGEGDFGVHSISLAPNNLQQKRILVEIIALVLLADALYFLSLQNEAKKKTVILLAGITALISLPIAIRGIPDGHDLMTHFLRIEAVVQALRSGQFPARISLLSHFGYGYPFSIYYNDILLYFPAVLRIFGFSVNTAYKAFILAVNALTVGISYASFRRITGDRKTGMLLTLFYVTASYRLVNVYIRAAVGEYTAQMFLPLLALAVRRIFTREPGPFKNCFTDSLLLAFGLSGLIGTHVLTTIMACFVMILVCLCQWRKLFRRHTLLTIAAAGLLTLLLNLYFIIPFVDYYFSVPTVIREIVDKNTQMIQQYGAYPAQFFSFFQNPSGKAEQPINGRLQLTPGLTLMSVLCLAIGLRFFRKGEKKSAFNLIFSLLMLWIASDMFPWNTLTRFVPGWNFIAQVQFPWRYLTFAVLFMTLLSAEILQQFESKQLRFGLALSAVLMALWFTGNLFEKADILRIYDTSGIKLEWTGPEYRLVGTIDNQPDPDANGQNIEAAEVISRNSFSVRLYCRAGSAPGKHIVSAPVYNYKGYHVTDADGNEFQIDPDVTGTVNFELPDGFDGTVTVEFQDPACWTAGLWVSAITLVLVIGSVFAIKKREQES